MVITHVKGQLIYGRFHQPDPVAGAQGPVLSLLGELVHGLEELSDGACTMTEEASPERWQDDAFTYLQCDLPEQPDAEIDINIHDGKVYVRIARSNRRASV